MNMVRLAVVSTLIAAFGSAMAADTGLSQADRDFITKAAKGGLMEVAAGNLAAKRGLDPAVKEFGQKMVTDHTAANERLKSLADSKQLNLPDSLSPEESANLGKLEALVGTDFDQTYSHMMVKDHVDDISDFEKELKKGNDSDVKSFAETTLPTLRHHQMLANRLYSQEKKSSSRAAKQP